MLIFLNIDIRIPLEWREIDNAKAKAGTVQSTLNGQQVSLRAPTDTHYGVFCLFKMGNQVMDSSTLADVDRTTMDIVFRDTIIL